MMKTIMKMAGGLAALAALGESDPAPRYTGRHVAGAGDEALLRSIDQAFESLQASPDLACLPLMYKRDWDGFVEGPTWPCWWIQNSFGPAYAMMPFLEEPYATWLEHAQGLWFRLMGDGQRKDVNGFTGPDGCLCDAAFVNMNGSSADGFGDPRGAHSGVADGRIQSEGIWYRQGDGNPRQHDWFIGATAGGLILETERLLIRHDAAAARARLPELERVAAFLDSRRDGQTDLLKGAMAANLLAPAYSGVRQPDGTFGPAYLAELSVNYVAGLERLAEVCVLCGAAEKAERYRGIAVKVRAALPRLMAPDGCFIMSEDPDGTRHGVFGAAKHGYFEATPNHDAGCFRVTDDETNRKIIQRMLTLTGTAAPGGLAPHGLIIPNYPGYDDSVHGGGYGHWVNGGHWTTTQGRMSIACLRANEFAHPFGAWARMRALMEGFRADAPLGNWGTSPWGGQLAQPYNTVFDCWGAPAGLLRGLFEYDYRADGLRVRPHLPGGILSYNQRTPARFGRTQVRLAVTGTGQPTAARANGKSCPVGADGWIALKPDANAGVLDVEIACGGAPFRDAWKNLPAPPAPAAPPADPSFWGDVHPWAPATSGNNNSLCIGASPNGGLQFSGSVRDFQVYRRELSSTELSSLVRATNQSAACVARLPLDSADGKLFAAANTTNPAWVATLGGPEKPSFRDGALVLENGAFLELPSSAETDFSDTYTLAAWFRPSPLLAGGARLIDRCTAGTQDGVMIDYLQGGKLLRLITPLGIIQAPVDLAADRWQHIAATCSTDGLMRLYVDGAQVGETRGARPTARPAAPPSAPIDLQKVYAFHQDMIAAGKSSAYETALARVVVELLQARWERIERRKAGTLSVPDLQPIPAAKLDAVEALYLQTARKVAGGLVDRLGGRSLWPACTDQAVVDVARRDGLLPKER